MSAYNTPRSSEPSRPASSGVASPRSSRGDSRPSTAPPPVKEFLASKPATPSTARSELELEDMPERLGGDADERSLEEQFRERSQGYDLASFEDDRSLDDDRWTLTSNHLELETKRAREQAAKLGPGQGPRNVVDVAGSYVERYQGDTSDESRPVTSEGTSRQSSRPQTADAGAPPPPAAPKQMVFMRGAKPMGVPEMKREPGEAPAAAAGVAEAKRGVDEGEAPPLTARGRVHMMAAIKARSDAAGERFVGLRLVGPLRFDGRRLPKVFKCGVCAHRNDARLPSCVTCKKPRVAPWQRHKGKLLHPGCVLVPAAKTTATLDFLAKEIMHGALHVAIVTSIERVKKVVHVVAFRDEASWLLPPTSQNPEPATVKVEDLDDYDILDDDDDRADKFKSFALCPNCGHVFYICNGDLTDDVRKSAIPQLAAEKKRNVALLEETRARKEHLKKTDQNNFDAILQCTAEIKSLELLLRRMTRRLAEPQQWCPRCLNNHFELAA